MNKLKIPFDYVVVTGSIVTAATSQINLALAMDSDFECHQYLGSSNQDAASDIQPNNFTVKITNASTGRQLASDRVPQRLISPYPHGRRLIQPIMFPANTVLQFDFLNLNGSTAIITFVLSGYKLLIPGAR